MQNATGIPSRQLATKQLNGKQLHGKQPNGEQKHGSDSNMDLRVRRTRKLILQAMVELTVEKGFGAITVQDLADRAMVNRSTFYRHFLDKYDLLDAYMDDVYARCTEEEFLADKLGTKPKDAPSGLLTLLRLIQQDADFFRVMLGPQGDAYLVGRMRDNTEQRFRNLLNNYAAEPEPDGAPVEMRISYIAYAGIGAITWWLDNMDACSAEELARWMGQLSSGAAGLPMLEFLHRANSVENNPPLNRPRHGNGR